MSRPERRLLFKGGVSAENRLGGTALILLLVVAFSLACGCTTNTTTVNGVTTPATSPQVTASPQQYENTGTLPSCTEPVVNVQHYDLFLDLDFKNGTLDGLTTITATALKEIDFLELDFMGFDVYGVRVGGEPATFNRTGEPDHLLNIDLRGVLGDALPAGSVFNVTVEYGGTPPTYYSFGMDLGLVFDADCASAFAEPDGARSWFPCVDRSDDKASFNLTVTVPEGMLVASNGLLWNADTGDGRTTYHYGTPHPVATYLVVMAAGNYTLLEEEHHGLPLRYYVPPERAAESRMLFAVIPAALDFFNETFGPYPFKSLGCVIASRGVYDETQTMILLDPFIYEREYASYVLVHELAHHWWGDSVTLPDFGPGHLLRGPLGRTRRGRRRTARVHGTPGRRVLLRGTVLRADGARATDI